MIQKPPFEITGKILKQVERVGRLLGNLQGMTKNPETLRFRRENQIKTIHSSLAIEGNTLPLSAVEALANGDSVTGSQREIQEVKNAIEVYDALSTWEPLSEDSFLKAQAGLLRFLITDNGRYRVRGVGIFDGQAVNHMAPPAAQVPELMSRLFEFLKSNDYSWLIKACVFHYELAFIHPFSDGNGRMSRLWQQVILMKDDELFGLLPVEEIIRTHQDSYYQSLRESDKKGTSTPFIEFILEKIIETLEKLPSMDSSRLKPKDRLAIARKALGDRLFSRKAYQEATTTTAVTASRDLKLGVDSGLLKKSGDKASARYSFC